MDSIQKLTRDEIKSIQLELLIIFDSFCKDNSFKYSLAGGTLLGAIRHKGFIPWDDDIDVVVSRDVFDSMIKYCKHNKLSANCHFEFVENSDTIYPFGKLYMDNTYIDCSDTPFHKGIWIDIFPYDKISKDGILAIKKLRMLRALILAQNYRKKVNSGYLVHIIKKVLGFILSPIPTRFFTKRMNSLARKYNSLYANEGYYGNIVWGWGEKEIMKYGILDELIEVDFEQHKFWAMKDYDIYLKSLYGNYMELPPENKRKIHGFNAWRIMRK